ncbi:MAG: glycerol-3-phosphate 1-O-acyltransferase PlsY [Aquificae bacterium]|nr:glycerol-3-phosphate 1-O-acyltransferase PlsY [Aquificota bacterium]
MPIFPVAYLLFTYLLASIPFGYIIGKLFGKDVRQEGSGNIGATNVARTVGKGAGILVLILDALKGFIPVYLAKNIWFFFPEFVGLVGITAVIGHCFSIFMGFKGGKGVATGFGVLLALSFQAGFVVFLLWLGVFLISGYVSLASIVASMFAPAVVFAITDNIPYTMASLISSIIIIYKHSSNIDRLIKGTENRFLYR